MRSEKLHEYYERKSEYFASNMNIEITFDILVKELIKYIR